MQSIQVSLWQSGDRFPVVAATPCICHLNWKKFSIITEQPPIFLGRMDVSNLKTLCTNMLRKKDLFFHVFREYNWMQSLLYSKESNKKNPFGSRNRKSVGICRTTKTASQFCSTKSFPNSSHLVPEQHLESHMLQQHRKSHYLYSMTFPLWLQVRKLCIWSLLIDITQHLNVPPWVKNLFIFNQFHIRVSSSTFATFIYQKKVIKTAFTAATVA